MCKTNLNQLFSMFAQLFSYEIDQHIWFLFFPSIEHGNISQFPLQLSMAIWLPYSRWNVSRVMCVPLSFLLVITRPRRWCSLGEGRSQVPWTISSRRIHPLIDHCNQIVPWKKLKYVSWRITLPRPVEPEFLEMRAVGGQWLKSMNCSQNLKASREPHC